MKNTFYLHDFVFIDLTNCFILKRRNLVRYSYISPKTNKNQLAEKSVNYFPQ